MSVDGRTAEADSSIAMHARRLAVVRRYEQPRSISPIGLLEYAGHEYRFAYLARVRALAQFRPLLGFPDVNRVYQSRTLFPFFAQRVMDRRRPEFAEFVRALDLSPDASELDILGRSGGWRKADNKLQVIDEPIINTDGTTGHTFLVHGVRHADSPEEERIGVLDHLAVGGELALVPEPENPVNPDALVVKSLEGVALGWIPDVLLGYARTVMESGAWSLTVRCANDATMPWHFRLLVRLDGEAPSGYRPFAGQGWELAPRSQRESLRRWLRDAFLSGLTGANR